MALALERCTELVNEFVGLYPAASQVSFKIAPTIEDLYGAQARHAQYKGARGGYSPATAANPRAGCDLYAANIRDEDQLVGILRHELFGHFGINTLSPQDKQAVLSGIVRSQNDPELAILWNMVNELYADSPLLLRAEEIFAFASEAIQPWQLQFAGAGQRCFEACCRKQLRPLAITDLQSITIMVANSMRNPELAIQTIPLTKRHQFDRDNVTCEGTYVGKVLSVGDGWVEQRINREGETVTHIGQLLSAQPKAGDVVDIRYQGGLGAVRGLEKGMERGR